MEQTYRYEKQNHDSSYRGDEGLLAISLRFYSTDQIVNEKFKVTAQMSNGVLKVREIIAGSLERGSLTLGEQREMDADEVHQVDFYKVIREGR